MHDGGWGTRGSWFMNPHQEAYVLDTDTDTDTDNNCAAFYAASAGGVARAGPYGRV